MFGFLVKKMNLLTNEISKRIGLISWVVENMKNPNIEICSLIESRMNEIIVTYTVDALASTPNN